MLPLQTHILPPGAGTRILDATRFAPQQRQMLSGPGLRTFLNIADEWQLSEQERLAVLGFPARSTFHKWARQVRGGVQIKLSVDALTRISAVLGIYSALRTIFLRQGDALAWLRAPNKGRVFGGQSPLALITSGAQDNLLLVRRHLDAWMVGLFAPPTPAADQDVAPATDDDLVFV